MNRRTIWRVPLYLILAGMLSFRLSIFLYQHFAVTISPDQVVSVDRIRSMFVSGGIWIGVLLLGGLCFFRKMTKKEIFISASAAVVIYVIVLWVQVQLQQANGGLGTVAFYLAEISGWNDFISSLLLPIVDSPVVASLLSYLSVYLFVPFGKKKEDTV